MFKISKKQNHKNHAIFETLGPKNVEHQSCISAFFCLVLCLFLWHFFESLEERCHWLIRTSMPGVPSSSKERCSLAIYEGSKWCLSKSSSNMVLASFRKISTFGLNWGFNSFHPHQSTREIHLLCLNFRHLKICWTSDGHWLIGFPKWLRPQSLATLLHVYYIEGWHGFVDVVCCWLRRAEPWTSRTAWWSWPATWAAPTSWTGRSPTEGGPWYLFRSPASGVEV